MGPCQCPWQCHRAVAGGTNHPGGTVRAAQSVAQKDLVVAHTRKHLVCPFCCVRAGMLCMVPVCTSCVTSPRATLAVVPSVNHGGQSSHRLEGEDVPKPSQAPVQHGRRVGQRMVGLKVTGDGQKKKKKTSNEPDTFPVE